MSYTPKHVNLVTVFHEACERYADKPLFGTREQNGWTWTSYREFGELVNQARGGLASIGIGAGDRVAVISNNRLEWAVCAYACYTRAAIYVPMYEAQMDEEWHYILQDSGAKLCFVANGAIADRVTKLMADLPDLSQVIRFGSDPYRDLFSRGQAAPVPSAAPGDHDVATYIYTSGTTGNPKGVELSHYNLAANVSALIEVSPLREDERSLAFLPWAHVFGGCIELNTGIALGGSIAICDNTDNLLSYLPEVAPTTLFAVPRIWNRIYDGVQKQIQAKPAVIQKIFRSGLSARSKLKRGQPLSLGEKLALPLAEKLVFSKIVGRFGGRLRFALSGAAALSRDVAEFIDNLGIQVYEGYGMTESSGCTTANSPEACRIGSVGKPVPGVRVTLDPSAPGAGEGEGEIIIHGTGVMRGYHNLDEATRDTLTSEGGLRSGDLGRFDADGFLFITGRVKELYKLENGKYVAPAPLEERLQLSPYILQCVVYGSDRPHNVALIVPDMPALQVWAQSQGLSGDPQSLLQSPKTLALFRAEIDNYSRDFKGFESIREFLLEPRELSTANGMLTPTLKLKRRAIMQAYEERLKALY